jgi:hypothetical protein
MLTLFAFLAAIVERLNELTFGRVFGAGKKYPNLGWILYFTALVYGILLAIGVHFAVIAWAAKEVAGVDVVFVEPYIDYALSGILLSGGAGILHEIMPKKA